MKAFLIATTALIGVATFASAAPLAAHEPAFVDANAEFLCNYGFSIWTKMSSSSGGEWTGDLWVRAATPVIGNGQLISSVIVANAPDGTTGNLSVAIYTSKRRKPHQELVDATVGRPRTCERVKVPISPTLLDRGKRYWVVETALQPSEGPSDLNTIQWVYDKKHSQGALWQYGYCSNGACFHYTAWKPISGGVPYARVR